MGNSKFHLSREAKDIIESLKIVLEIKETPVILKLALAKGIKIQKTITEIEDFNIDNFWLVSDNVIKDQDYILFKHIIINETKKIINDKDLNKYFAYYIESGLKELKKNLESKDAYEDIRISILDL